MAEYAGDETEPAGGLYAFQFAQAEGQERKWHVLLPALASMVDKTPENISMLTARNPRLLQDAPPVLRLRPGALHAAVWTRLLATYAAVQVSLQAGGERKRVQKRPPQNLTLYPLKSIYASSVTTLQTWTLPHCRLQIHSPGASFGAEGKHNADQDEEAGLAAGSQDDGRPSSSIARVVVPKREPVSYMEFPTVMAGARILIDLTRVGAGEDDDDAEGEDAVQGQLADNYLAPQPPEQLDTALKRSYRLLDEDISTTLKERASITIGTSESPNESS